MKKIKKISIRLTQEDYILLFNNYIWEKENRDWTDYPFKTFSDYVRFILTKGLHE